MEKKREMPAIGAVSDMQVTMETVGGERNRVLVADNFFKDPEKVRNAALRLKFATGRGAYPGYEARPPWDSRPLSEALRRLSGLRLDPEGLVLSFSVVTKRNCELAPWQRTPHFDPADVAGVVYLNLPEQCRGGTAFYRHRASGLEAFPERPGRRVAALMRRHGLDSMEDLLGWVMSPPRGAGEGFITESNKDWELLKFIEMKFNRLVLYGGRLFHSGYIQDGWFGECLETRRLTLNVFAALERPRRVRACRERRVKAARIGGQRKRPLQ